MKAATLQETVKWNVGQGATSYLNDMPWRVTVVEGAEHTNGVQKPGLLKPHVSKHTNDLAVYQTMQLLFVHTNPSGNDYVVGADDAVSTNMQTPRSKKLKLAQHILGSIHGASPYPAVSCLVSCCKYELHKCWHMEATQSRTEPVLEHPPKKFMPHDKHLCPCRKECLLDSFAHQPFVRESPNAVSRPS
jgi:hypothetical protein|uniref:Uncharacterized protein n=1 Tax=Eutreptiella gymnastica TaxID=73025 RepID=A0A6T2B777_9EUGL|mmetsp:Transcript_66497/g.111199  ORF Transcript_66497/g.111199 Transcript_66497/m.111199 type:complete len:189 (-) Transcript_66497:805-1371(-)